MHSENYVSPEKILIPFLVINERAKEGRKKATSSSYALLLILSFGVRAVMHDAHDDVAIMRSRIRGVF